ncbi:MAG: TM2 domain-containing protein [Bacteroidales bacterium]|nr:TM2 domain-containing protein [Bacteroidales bacterium]
MTQELIQTFMMKNGECFDTCQLSQGQQMLSEADDSKSSLILGQSFQNPTFILVIAIVFGWERFFLDDIAMAILKIVTCYGCGIWWLIDVFSAKKRATDYNFKKLTEVLMYCK